MIRRVVPYTLLPLSLIACVLASTPWLRSFPSSFIAVPLFGAAVLSVLVPVVIVGIGVRRLWVTIALDVVAFVVFTTLVALRELNGLGDLYAGIVHGPSQILSIALPLVSPRTLLVAPVALAWLCGATVGECLARGWQSVLPYATIIATFGLAYGGTARAISSTADGRRYDTLLAATILVLILLLRAAHSWVVRDGGAESADADSAMPLRSLAAGAAISIVIGLAAALVVQIDVFRGPPAAPSRDAPIQSVNPVDPIAFVSGLRLRTRSQLFTFSVDARASNYVTMATADDYNGDTWSLNDLTFIPSGGVIPDDKNASVTLTDPAVTQIYTITGNWLSGTPWMPYQSRPQRVFGRSVDINVESGMIVPSQSLSASSRYSVRSVANHSSFEGLPPDVRPSSTAPGVDSVIAEPLRDPLAAFVRTLEQETGVSSATAGRVAFLKAVVAYFRKYYFKPNTPRAGGTGFADVLASIRGTGHTATPEQYATLIALVARQVSLPARVVTGFRIEPTAGVSSLREDTYSVTSGEAWTWVEIPIEGLGWVVLDPTPSRVAGKDASSAPTTAGATQPSTTVPTVIISAPGRQEVAPRSRIPGSKEVTSSLVLVILGGVGVLLICAIAALLLRKRIRALRRSRGDDPRQRLLGAWQESLDMLRESGLDDPREMTSAEVAAATEHRYGAQSGEHARFIGERANVAIFSPATSVADADADAAWRAHDRLRSDVRTQLSLRERVEADLRYQRHPGRRAEPGPPSWAAASRARSSRPRHRRR